jgi:hypothetical protein
MIVRNEAEIIERCLASVAPYIAYWVILDTGSDDDTPALIERFFRDTDIPGELHHGEFVDFSTSRNQALELCRRSKGDFDYILLIDADMELLAEDESWLDGLDAPAYSIRQHNDLVYDNVRVLQRASGARYVGVTHEYLDVGGQAPRLAGVRCWITPAAPAAPRKSSATCACCERAWRRNPTMPATCSTWPRRCATPASTRRPWPGT